jgi:hypothetical protein
LRGKFTKIDLGLNPEFSLKILNYNNNFKIIASVFGKSRARKACVFFAQHSLENRANALWEQPFFIAPQVCSANVHSATEGASPCRAFRVGGSHRADAKS